MLQIADFLSWSVLLPAALAGGAALMAWRGLHLSGDKKYAPYWGAASALTFVLALIVGAIANHESLKAVRDADERAANSSMALDRIQIGISDLKRIVSPGNDSNIDVIAAALAKIQSQQIEISKIKRAARLDNHIYEEGQDRAMVANVTYDQSSRGLFFGLLTAQTPVDFSRELEFQWARIRCDDNRPYGSAAMGAAMNLQYSHVVCHVLGVIDGMQPTNPPTASPPSPTPPASPEGK